MALALSLCPIGRLLTPFASRAECPRNGRQLAPAPQCEAEIFPEYVGGLADLDGFSHLILLYWLNQSDGPALCIAPPFDGKPRGIFATRSPARPNPIGLSVVAFDGFLSSGRLAIRYLDCISGTPLLDIKPYLPATDAEPDAHVGWLEPHLAQARAPTEGGDG
jgi:tRNA-Thr(GGU) m(6)t(6)A37 methyltransferase TsaA